MSGFILQQGHFTSDVKSSEVELCNSFSFAKEKVDRNVLSFGSKSSCLGNHLGSNTIAIRSLDPQSLFMYVISLICDFGAFDEDQVVSLKDEL